MCRLMNVSDGAPRSGATTASDVIQTSSQRNAARRRALAGPALATRAELATPQTFAEILRTFGSGPAWRTRA